MDCLQEEMSPADRDLEFLEGSPPATMLTRSPSTPVNLVSSHGFNAETKGYELDEVDEEEDDQNGEEDDDDDVVGVGSLLAGDKRKLRSKAWREYVPIYEDGQTTKGECMHCTALIGAMRGAGTSALRNHLKRCKTRLENVRVVDQLHATLMSPDGVSIGKWKFDQEES